MENNIENIDIIINSSRVDLDNGKNKLNQYVEQMKIHTNPENQKELCKLVIEDMKKYSGIYISTNYEGKNLLMVIAELNKDIITKSLVGEILSARAESIKEVNLKDKNNPAFFYAAIAGNIVFLEEAERHILNYNMENKNNNDDETALTLAAKNNKIDFLKKMFELEITSLKKGKKFNLSIKEIKRSLLIAAECGHTAIVDFLLSKGLDSNIKNTDGKTPLMLAIKNNHYEVISILRKQSSIARISFTAACFCKKMAECISSYQETYPELVSLLEQSANFIKPLIYAGYSTISMLEYPFTTLKFYKTLSQNIPHPFEKLIINNKEEKYFIDYFYGTGHDPQTTVDNHSPRSNNNTQSTLQIGSSNNGLPPTRDRRNLSVVAESVAHNTNSSEHSMSSSSGIIETLQENSGGSSQVNVESAREGENKFLRLRIAALESQKAALKEQAIKLEIEEDNLKKIAAKGLASPSPIRQKTPSTQSMVTSGTRSVPCLNLAKLSSDPSTASSQLSQLLSAFPDAASSSTSYQNRHQDGNIPQPSSSHSLVNLENNRQHH